MPPMQGGIFSIIRRDSVAKNLRITYCVLPPAAAIRSIPFDGIYIAILDLLHDSSMVRYAILVPVKEDNHSRFRGDSPVCPLVSGFEPLHTGTASGKFGNDRIQISTFASAPAYKAGTPFYSFRKSVPAPIGFPSHITNLRSGNLYH